MIITTIANIAAMIRASRRDESLVGAPIAQLLSVPHT
jgi:hypothetical protein